MVSFIRFGDVILTVEHVSSVIRKGCTVEVRMIRMDGSTEPDFHRFEGATADCVWDAFADMADPDVLARLKDYEDRQGG